MESQKRATVYFDAEVHQALRLKAAASPRSISEMVNEAVRVALAEDAEDLSAFEDQPSRSAKARVAFPSSPSFRIRGGVAGYRLRIKPSATKEIDAISAKRDRQRIMARIAELAGKPRPRDCEKLAGSEGRLSSSAGQGAQDLVHMLDGEREVSLGRQEPHARAWQRRRLMAAVLRRDHEVVLAVP